MSSYLPNKDYSLYTCSESGDVFATTRGINKMIKGDANANTKFYALQSVELSPPKMAEVPTVQGLRTVELWDEFSISNVVEYYAFKGVEHAQQTLKSCFGIGLRVFIQNQTGFAQAHKTVTPLIDELQRRWDYLRDTHVVVYAAMQKFGGKVTDKLNIAYYGVSCKEFKAARHLQQGHLSEFCPDYATVEELEELVYLRKAFVTSKGTTENRIKKAVEKTRKAFPSD